MTKQPIFFILVLLAFSPVFFLGSCTSENLVPACDTLNMSYSQNIVPILKNNCYTCHSKGNTAGSIGILLDNYASVMFYIVPDAPSRSWLVGNIRHDPPDSLYNYVPMPYMKPKLDACSINQIVAWVNQGAKNN
jgi:hypothetical protein